MFIINSLGTYRQCINEEILGYLSIKNHQKVKEVITLGQIATTTLFKIQIIKGFDKGKSITRCCLDFLELELRLIQCIFYYRLVESAGSLVIGKWWNKNHTVVCYCSAGNDQNITVCPLLLGSDDKIFMMKLMFQMKIYCTNCYNYVYFTWKDNNYPWSQKYELSFQQVFLCNKSSHLKKILLKTRIKRHICFTPPFSFS